MDYESDEIFDERKDEAFKADFFENAYPSILKDVKRAICRQAENLRFREGLFDDLLEQLRDDLNDFPFSEFLEFGGAKPFDPWSVPTKDAPKKEDSLSDRLFDQIKSINEVYMQGMKAGRK